MLTFLLIDFKINYIVNIIGIFFINNIKAFANYITKWCVNMIHDIGEIKTSRGNVLLKMWIVTVEDGARSFRRHNHTRFEISTVLEGRGTYTVGEKEYPISTGEVFVFCSNEQHCITDVTKELKILNAQFEPSYIKAGGADGLSSEHQNFCFHHSANFKNRIPAEQSEKLRNLLFDIKDELTAGYGEYSLAVKSRLNLIIISLIRDFAFCDGVTDSSHAFKDVMKAISYIDRHLTEPLSLEKIADAAGISPTYFSFLFKKLCHMNLWNYIISKRVEKAAYLICDEKNEQTVLQIALACGFNSTASFNKQFKRITGLTPTRYRKEGHGIITY